MVVADRPAASGPSSTGSAAAKSPVDSPRRYKTGKTSSSRGERRMYGGRIWLVYRCPGRRSCTRGAWIFIGPAPVVSVRGWALPFRTTSACPCSSRSRRIRSPAIRRSWVWLPEGYATFFLMPVHNFRLYLAQGPSCRSFRPPRRLDRVVWGHCSLHIDRPIRHAVCSEYPYALARTDHGGIHAVCFSYRRGRSGPLQKSIEEPVS